MTEVELINKRYFDWMCQLVCDRRYDHGRSYRRLFELLHETAFYYIHPMDSNRFEDGVNFRYRFGYENGYNESVIAELLDRFPCSVFEMMVALAFRCEEQFMQSPEEGNRTAKWFWSMIESLGLMGQTDDAIEPDDVDYAMVRFLERRYAKNGQGGLFTVNRPNCDMRTAEIWYQMNWYIDSIL